ncbi:hypothetical protein D3C73_1208370 [compost metagenome]
MTGLDNFSQFTANCFARQSRTLRKIGQADRHDARAITAHFTRSLTLHHEFKQESMIGIAVHQKDDAVLCIFQAAIHLFEQ